MKLTAKMPIVASFGKVSCVTSSMGSSNITREELEVFKLPICIGEFLFFFCYFHVPLYCNAIGSSVKDLKDYIDTITFKRFYSLAKRRGLIKIQSFVNSEEIELFQKQYITSHSTRTTRIKVAGKLVANTLGSEVPHYAT